MKILLKNIPSNTSISDISSFIKSSYDKGILSFFRPSGQIKEVNIVSQEIYSYDNKLTYHGLVKLEPDNIAERTITRLNKTLFKNRRIILREFTNRSWHNDKRGHSSSGFDCENDRRNTDRRITKLANVSTLLY